MFVVTGATGHIGNAFVRLLIEKNEPVKLLLRKPGKATENLSVPVAYGDIFDRDFLSREVHKGDIFVHLAGLIDLTNQMKKEMIQVNDVGTKIITDFCFQNQIKLVYTSSVDAIYKKTPKQRVTEPTAFYPELLKKSTYSMTKAAGTAYVLNKITNEQMNAVILYPSAVFGIHDYKPSAVGKEIRSLINKSVFFYFAGGYDFIDVRDTAMAIYQAAIKPVKGSYILSGHPVTIRTFFEEIAKNMNHKVHFIRIPVSLARIGAIFLPDVSQMMVDALVDNYNYCNDRMRQDLLPELIPFSQSVQETIHWFRENEAIFESKAK